MLVSAGNIKRADTQSEGQDVGEWEQSILIRSICETFVPKLIAEDIPLLRNLLSGVFPGADILPIHEEVLLAALRTLCKKHNLVDSEPFIDKVLQLH